MLAPLKARHNLAAKSDNILNKSRPHATNKMRSERINLAGTSNTTAAAGHLKME
jgi:hypothetical protein